MKNGSENKILSELTRKKSLYDFYHTIKKTHFNLGKGIEKFLQTNSNTPGKSEKCINFHMCLSITVTTADNAGWR